MADKTLDHVIVNVLDISNNSDCYRCLIHNHITHAYHIVNIEETFLEAIEYERKDSAGKILDKHAKIPIFHRSLVLYLSLYLKHVQTQKSTLDENIVLNLTKHDFDNFRIASPPLSVLKATTTVINPSITTAPHDEYVTFLKGVKRDKSQYPELKDERNFENWRRTFVATAKSHRIEEVFNPTYTPLTYNDINLFSEKQKFAYTVLDATLKTDMGKTLVRKHEATGNAQLIWKEFVEYATTSTKAQLNSSDILKWITSAKYDPNTWKNSSHNFILYWINQVKNYESFVPDPNDRLTNAVKLTLIQNTVTDIPELRQIRINVDLDVAKGGKQLTYTQYVDLLLSAAHVYDKKISTATPRSKTQQVFLVDNDFIDTDTSEDIVNTGIDDDIFHVDTYLSHVTNRKPPVLAKKQRAFNNHTHARPFIAADIWSQLPAEAQDILRKGYKQSIPSTNAVRSTNLNELLSPMLLSDVDPEPTDIAQTDDALTLFNNMAHQSSLDPNDLRSVLSTNTGIRKKGESSVRPKLSSMSNDGTIELNGVKYRPINMTTISYQIHNKVVSKAGYALVDRGANGGVLGSDTLILETTSKVVNIVGIDSHEIKDVPLCTGAGYTLTQHGPIIIIMHQYAYLGQGKTIHSSIQMEHYKNCIDDRSIKAAGGTQRISTPDGYVIPISIIQGLPYIKMRIPTSDELDSLPHVILTSDANWDPTIMDSIIDDDDPTFYETSDLEPVYPSHTFDQLGNYRHADLTDLHASSTSDSACVDSLISDMISRHVQNVKLHAAEPNYSDLRPYFGWSPVDVIKQTFKATTQHARSLHLYDNMRKHYKSRFPAFNVSRRNESVATDTIFSDTPAVDSGATCAQIFVGRESLVCDVYGMKSPKDFIKTLEDNIRFRGAMDKLISDRALSEISNKVKDICRAYFIDEWQSEPHHQHQNFAERHYQVAKGKTNLIMNRTGAPADTWLLCLTYAVTLLNHLSHEILQWKTPMQILTGSTSDISKFLQFYFWEEVYYSKFDPGFPSDSTEEKGNFVGFGETVGDAMTFKVLTKDSKKIMYRSNVRSAENDPQKLNKRLDNNSTKPDLIFIKSKSDNNGDLPSSTIKPLPGFNPSELIGRSYLGLPDEDGQKFRMRIVKAICDIQENIDKQPEMVKFLVQGRNNNIDEIISYNDIIDHIQRNNANDNEINNQYLKFRSILAHQGPLTSKDPSYKGSSYNVLVDWEDGECTYEPLDILAKDDPVTCALYAKNNGLLDQPGWKRFKRIANRDIKLTRLLNQTRLRSVRRTMRYQYGFLVPNTHSDALELDRVNGNSLWQDAEGEEIALLLDYSTFNDLGKGAAPPPNYQKIRCHMVYAVKYDGRHRARLVAGGHLTPLPLDSVYSGVVSLRSLRIVVFLAELNGLLLWNADVGSAYLEALTKEKVYIIAGHEFGDLAGHTLVIVKALYGLRSSGQRWHERFADIMREIGFFQSLADSDVWMKRNGDIYEYVAVYVDDLAIAMIDPQSFISLLLNKHKLKLKGVGNMSFHLGCDFFRDPDDTLCFGPKKYIDKMLDNFEKMHNEKPKEYSSPLDKNDHPELDTSNILDANGTKQYQSMIGELQWAISLGRFDILTAVMSMSQYRVAPRKGHLFRLKRIYGYLKQFKTGAIRVRTEIPDYSGLHDVEYDWEYNVYGSVKELVPDDIPTPLGKGVVLSHYTDANLYHNYMTGRAVTGVLHLINKMPIDWYSKAQATVETATYGSEFVAARIAVDQIIDLRTTLRYLGVPILGKSYLFGDNESVWKSSTIPHSSLKKRHNAVSYHRVREAIAAKIIGFFKIDGKLNPADLLSKHLGHAVAWPLLKPLLFWRGNTAFIKWPEDRTKGEYEDGKQNGNKMVSPL